MTIEESRNGDPLLLKITGRLDRDSLSTWVYAIARNTVLDYYRRSRPSLSLEELEGLPDDTVPADDAVIRRERLRELALAFDRLSSRERDIIILRFHQGLIPGEIARKMNISFTNRASFNQQRLRNFAN